MKVEVIARRYGFCDYEPAENDTLRHEIKPDDIEEIRLENGRIMVCLRDGREFETKKPIRFL